MATACKATTADHAVVRVYEAVKWQPVGEPLAGHSLTVTKISFSPDDRYILSVSRDRTWRLFEREAAGGKYFPHKQHSSLLNSSPIERYRPITADKTHTRIIWDCDWSREGDVFATASRDKTVRSSLLC